MLSEYFTNIVKHNANLFDYLLDYNYLGLVVGLDFIQVFLILGVNQVGLEVEFCQLLEIILLTLLGEGLLLVELLNEAFQV